MTKYFYNMTSFWRPSMEPPEIGRKFLQTLDDLSKTDQAFHGWGLLQPIDEYVEEIQLSKLVPIESVRNKMTELVEENVYRGDDEEAWPDGGYSMAALTDYDQQPRRMEEHYQIRMQLGGTGIQELKFTAGDVLAAPKLALVTYPIFRAVMEVLASIWPCNAIVAWGTEDMENPKYVPHTWPGTDVVTYEVIGSDQIRLPWFCWLSAAYAPEADPPPQLIVEHLQNGAMLLAAAEERLDFANPEHMARARLLDAIVNRLSISGAEYWWSLA
ncbi:MAG: immunity 52 family protein [Caulobacteraceae bacterium]|nr:immunity 52 family protein [Caulobacteraceae bacterium]